jgi:hypothetical protein
MECTEHIAWIAPMLATAAALVVLYYGHHERVVSNGTVAGGAASSEAATRTKIEAVEFGLELAAKRDAEGEPSVAIKIFFIASSFAPQWVLTDCGPPSALICAGALASAPR